MASSGKSSTKYFVIAAVVLLLVGGGFMFRGFSLASFLDGETEQISRGDLTIPITANGSIDANQLIEMKAKASGEVQTIHVVEGQMVKAGDLLIELDPVDEQRNLERAEATLQRAEASLMQNKIALSEQEKTLPLNTIRANAALDDSKSRMMVAEVDWKKTDDLYNRKPPIASKQEWTLRKSNFQSAEASVKTAEANYESAQVTEKTNLQNAQQNVKIAEGAYNEAKKSFEETQLRLKETRIFAPEDGMIFAVKTKKGELVQSGKTSITGGTPLLYIADTSKLVVIAQVDEADIGAVRRVSPEYAQPGHTRLMETAELLRVAHVDDLQNPTSQSAPAANPLDSVVGQRVKVTVEAYRNDTFEGIIERILPQPQMLNNVRTFDVRIVLLGKDLQKLLGMQADVEFTADKVSNALRVKNEAIYSEGKESYVFTPVGKDKKDERKHLVKIGVTDGIYTEIRSGWPDKETEYFVKRPKKTQREQEESEKSK